MGRNILVTNDDGIDSPGLWALVRAVAPLGEHVYVVAPTDNQTAVGAGITLRRELRWTRYEETPVPGVEAWHVNGTPGDCVMIALRQIVQHWISFIASGVNQGANVGNDILASGTVGGALQGHFRGLSTMAFSQVTEDGEVDWSVSERVAHRIARAEFEGKLPEGIFLNVNVPNVALEEVSGVLVTRMGRWGYLRLIDGAGNTATVERAVNIHTDPDIPPGTDIWALANKYVSVSPLQSNLTDHRLIDVIGQELTAAFRE
jgi:5'-nucleotidase